VGLAIQHALRIGRAPAGGVTTLLAAKVNGRVAGAFVLGGLHFRGVGAVPADEALEAGPRGAERALGGEGLVGGQPSWRARSQTAAKKRRAISAESMRS
jgi:hypothetical protein